MKQTAPSTTTIPKGLVIALQTGRPELARLNMGEKATAEELDNFAEAVVRDIIRERENLSILLPGVQAARSNLQGALRTIERFELGIKLMLAGASAEEVSAALVRSADG